MLVRPESAFANCAKLTEIEFQDGLQTIGANAFNESPIRELIIPDTVTSMPVTAINNNRPKDVLKSSLQKVHWPAGKTTIPENQFADFKVLTEIEIPDGVKTIEKYAFCRCPKLANVELPDSLTSIRERAFYQCTGLRILEIPNGTKVADDAFEDCTGLTLRH